MDVENAERVRQAFGLQNRAQAVSIAVIMTRDLTRVMLEGNKLIIRIPWNWKRFWRPARCHKIVITGFND
jgi:hypothetical protein